jgi:hypothetical protein
VQVSLPPLKQFIEHLVNAQAPPPPELHAAAAALDCPSRARQEEVAREVESALVEHGDLDEHDGERGGAQLRVAEVPALGAEAEQAHPDMVGRSPRPSPWLTRSGRAAAPADGPCLQMCAPPGRAPHGRGRGGEATRQPPREVPRRTHL